jgi:hypothetical protein
VSLRNSVDRVSGIGLEFPGKEILALDSGPCEEGIGSVTLYGSVPSRGFSAFVRFNIFSELLGNRQHVASVIVPSGVNGELVSISGHIADSWHVTAQASTSRQDVKLAIIGLRCCASPRIRANVALLAPFSATTEAIPAPLLVAPITPMGDGLDGAGASLSVPAPGSGTLTFPAGARLTHWTVLGSAAGSNFTINGALNVLVGVDQLEGFPNGTIAVQTIDYVSLTVGTFEFVY